MKMQRTTQPTYNELLEKFQNQKENHRIAMKKYYNKKYKFSDNMSEEEREVVKKNLDTQYVKYKTHYELNKEYYTERNRLAREKKRNKKYLVENTNFLINTAMDKCQISCDPIVWGALNQ